MADAIMPLRLSAQGISGAGFKKPIDVVRRLGAVQAQDYLGSLWAIGLRMQGGTEAAIERALANRSIVRTWPMRGTMHIVAAADVRWMLELLTPRVLTRNALRLKREYGLDRTVVSRAADLIALALRNGRQLTRDAVYQVLDDARIETAGQRGLHILWQLAQQGLICFGAREGKQHTFVLLEEWVPQAKSLPREESLGELAIRYFTGHGPATLQDFVWWSGLTVADAKTALELARPALESEVIDDRTFWFADDSAAAGTSRGTLLLPAYDEYTVAYRDRSAAITPANAAKAGNDIFNPTIVVDGQVTGTWKRTLREGQVIVTPLPFWPIKGAGEEALAKAARRYGAFLGLPAVLAKR